MKILQVNKFFYKKGGSETYYFALRELLRSKGHEVMDFSMNNERNEPSKYQKYFIYPVNFDAELKWTQKIANSFHLLYSFEAAKKLELLIREEGRPDIAHLHNFSYQLTPSIIKVLRRHKIPIVWTLHDYKLISPNYNLFTRGQIDLSTKPDKFFRCVANRCVKDSYLKSFLAALEMFLHRKITGLYNKVNYYISPSKFLAQLAGEWGINPEKIIHLNNFTDLHGYQPVFENDGYHLFIGRFVEEKGVMQLLETFKNLPGQKLKIIGAGPLENQMHDFIADHNLKNVEILGPIYFPESYSYIQRAKSLIIPSIWLENNPIVMLEALGLGKPILGSNLGGIPEMIIEGQNGFVFDPHNPESFAAAVNKLDKSDLISFGQRSRKLFEELADSEKHYQKLMEIYKKAID